MFQLYFQKDLEFYRQIDWLLHLPHSPSSIPVIMKDRLIYNMNHEAYDKPLACLYISCF